MSGSGKNGAGHHRSSDRLEAIVLGSLGGALRPGGRSITFPQASKGEPGGMHIQRFHLAMAQAMAPSISAFAGETEPMPEFLS